MYKITLYDNNCSPICDGTTFWFVEDLEQFEKNWLPLQSKYDVKTIERYYKSKFGEIVTDYYSDSQDLNIVQEVDCEILQEKTFEFINQEVTLENIYGCRSTVLFDKLKIVIRVQSCDNKYYLVGQYFGYGCRRVENLYNRWYDKEVKYSQMNFYGNPVAQYHARYVDWENSEKDDAYKDFYTNDKCFYKNESIETFVWLPIKEVDKQYQINEIDSEDVSLLLRDIVGEAG